MDTLFLETLESSLKLKEATGGELRVYRDSIRLL